MKISKKTALIFTLVCLFLIGLAVPSYSWTRKKCPENRKFYNSKLSPIIMILEALRQRTALMAW